MENYELRHLPTDLVPEICARLPAKSLLRFKCVCKSWHSLISAPNFISMHLTHYHQDEDYTTLLVWDYKENTWLLPRRNPSRDALSYKKHSFPNHVPIRGHSVNGLFLKANLGLYHDSSRTEVVLWNPSIRKTLELPPIYVDDRVYFGLGFCSSGNDQYKVVAIATKLSEPVRVYTLGNPSWRVIHNYKEDVIRRIDKDGAFIDGHIYWTSTRNCMVSFNVNNEVFDYIVLPYELTFRRSSRYPISYHGLVGVLELCERDDTCSLWVMRKDNQVSTSWSKVSTTTITTLSGGEVCIEPWCKLVEVDFKPENCPVYVVYFKNVKMAFVNRRGVYQIYDFESKEMKDILENYGNSLVSYVALYKESLVLL